MHRSKFLKNIEKSCKRKSIKIPKTNKKINVSELKIKDGKFIGEDRGEFGGKLEFVKNKSSYIVMKGNVLGIYKLKKQIFVITGLAHMGFNFGKIYKVLKDKNTNEYKAIHWQSLPQEPFLIERINKYSILIDKYIVLGSNGKLKMLGCL